MQLSRIECVAYYKEKYCLMKLVSAACVCLYVCMTGLLCKLFLTMGCRNLKNIILEKCQFTCANCVHSKWN